MTVEQNRWLGPEWRDVGWIDETPFPSEASDEMRDLAAIQSGINKSLVRLASVGPNHGTFKIHWRDPEPIRPLGELERLMADLDVTPTFSQRAWLNRLFKPRMQSNGELAR